MLGTVQECLSQWLGVVGGGVVGGGEFGWPYDYGPLQTWVAGWVRVEVVGRIISLNYVFFIHWCLRHTTS